MTERIYPLGAGKIKLVSTDWLLAHLSDKDQVILDAQPDIHDYITEHIPDAIHINEGVLRVPWHGLPEQWMPPEAIQPVLRRLGLKADMPVVVYSGLGPFKAWGDGLGQTMVAYSLARFGHNNVLVLDGGIDKWKAEGKPLTKLFPKCDDSGFIVHLQRDYFLSYEEFKLVKDRPDVLLLDARPAPVYEGQGPWIAPGHIPGAVNLPWPSLMEPNNRCLLKPDAEVQLLLAAAGVTPEKTLVVYCGTGREATNELLLFKFYLGYPNVKLYEGSFTEWTAHPENPTVVGKSPR